MVRLLASSRTSAALACLVAVAWGLPGHAETTEVKPAASGSFPLVEAEPAEKPKAVEPEPASATTAFPSAPDAEKVMPPAASEPAPTATAASQPVPARPVFSAAPAIEADPDAPFRAFAILAGQERRRRLGGAIGGALAGGSSIAIGAILKSEENINPDLFYVVGALGIGFSALALFLPSTIESEARRLRVDQSGHSVEAGKALEQKWEEWAESAKRRRIRNAIGGIAFGAVSTGVGIAFLAGAADMSDDDRLLWGSLFLGGGAAMLASGGVGLLMMSPMESSYQFYAASRPPKRGAVSFKLRPLGLGLAANGTF